MTQAPPAEADSYPRWVAEQAGVSVEVAQLAIALIDRGLRSRWDWHIANARIISAATDIGPCPSPTPPTKVPR